MLHRRRRRLSVLCSQGQPVYLRVRWSSMQRPGVEEPHNSRAGAQQACCFRSNLCVSIACRYVTCEELRGRSPLRRFSSTDTRSATLSRLSASAIVWFRETRLRVHHLFVFSSLPCSRARHQDQRTNNQWNGSMRKVRSQIRREKALCSS